MREIKFRAWAKYGEMLENVQNHIGKGEWAFGRMLNSDDFIIMQFTGFKDSKGNDIYENDILQSYHFTDTEGVDHFINHAVKWSDRFNGWFALNAESMNEDDGSIQLFTYKRANKHSMKVIGSIYENPELLEG